MNSGSLAANSPATYFLRYLLIGVTLLIVVVSFGKQALQSTEGSYYYIAGGIFLINFLVVSGFTIAILRSPDLLLDQDAPDLAYYLGFSLTVAALATTFLTDIGLVTNDSSARTLLVTGALSQFGAGLLATLIGLCAKIYLTARQQISHVNPEDFYRRVRLDLSDLSKTVRSVTLELAGAVTSAASSIKAAGESAKDSVSQLSKSLKQGSDIVLTNLSPERISNPILAFVAELERLNVPAESVRASLKLLELSARELSSGLQETTAGAKTAVTVAQSAEQSLAGISSESEKIKEATSRLVVLLDAQKSGHINASAAMTKSTEHTLALTESMEALGKGFRELLSPMMISRVELVKALNDTTSHMTSLYEETGKVTSVFSSFQGTVPALEQSVKALNEAIHKHSEAEHTIAIGLGEVNRLVPTMSTDIQALCDTLRALNGAVAPLGEPFAGVVLRAAQHVTSLASEVEKLTPALASLGASGGPVGESFNRIAAPLNAATESLGDLNRAINSTSEQARALEDVVERLRLVAQARASGQG